MLNPEQQRQVSDQIEAYEKRLGVGVIEISLGNRKIALEMDEFVANPEIMNSGVQVVEFLVARPDIVKDKVVTDMGTGSGIIGVSSALIGARKVFMPDIDDRAVTNATKNVNHFHLEKVCEAFKSDLFSDFQGKEKASVQIFNHPFFSEQPVEGKSWTRMMFGGTKLIARYFEQAPKYSTENAVYILPWLTLAENKDKVDNDPAKRAVEYGYKIINVTEQKAVKRGLQQALFRIYELKLSK